MIVAGFPTSEDASRGVFNLRAAQALRSFVDVTVIFLRAWRPGRRWRSMADVAGITVVTIAVPQVPPGRVPGSRRDLTMNIRAYKAIGWFGARRIIRHCTVVHSVDVANTGVVASHWARQAARCHVTQAIGSDVNVVLPSIRSMTGIRGWEAHLHGVACNSNALKQRFEALYPGVPNVRTIYRGVDTGVFTPDGETLGALEKRAPLRFLYVGGFPRHQPTGNKGVKGGEILLTAWRDGERQLAGSGASLVIAGPHSNADWIRRWRETLQFPERVAIAGPIPPDEMPSYIRGCDAVVVPSLNEGLPNVCTEAAACGRAVVASRVGGIPEIVVDGETGILVPPGDPSAWKDALIDCAHDPVTLKAMGQRSRQRVELLFDRRQFPVRMVELYRAALDVHRSIGVRS